MGTIRKTDVFNKDLAKKSMYISREARSLMDERSVREIVRSTIHFHPHLFSTFLLFFDLYWIVQSTLLIYLEALMHLRKIW